MKMKLICKGIDRESSQDSFNLDIELFLTKRGIDYHKLTNEQRHKALFKIISCCNKCHLNRQGNLPPKYHPNPNPKLVFISRSSTKKDLKYGTILDYTNPQASVIKSICDIWETPMQDIYYTNTSFCITTHPNEITTLNCKRCYFYKDLELSTMELPRVIFLMGNDAFNTFYNENCTVNHILGSIYYSYYQGEYRLFIPIPHPVFLLRDTELLKTVLKFVSIIKESYDKGLLENIQEALNASYK